MTFTANLNKYAEQTKTDLGTAKRAIVFNLFSEAIKRTPVDTGRAKNNWFVSDGAPILQTIDKTESSRIGQLGSESAKQLGKINESFGLDILSNNLPYIQKLEFGSSNQAPAGMVRTTLRQFIKIANAQGWK